MVKITRTIFPVCVTHVGAIDPVRLHYVGLTLVNETTCRKKWGGLIQDSHICSHPAGSASCMVTPITVECALWRAEAQASFLSPPPQGDSGAPLLCQKHGTYFLFGVVTWGSRWCSPDKPAIFSKISHYRSWITDVTGDV